MKKQKYPVLIVGGGLVGLSTALFLSHHNIAYCVIERHYGTSIHPKARGINTRSMELFRPFQIEEQIRIAGEALSKGGGGLLQANTLLEADFSTIKDLIHQLVSENDQLSPTRGSFTTQDLMEPILLQAIQDHKGEVQFGMELVSFTQDEQGVTAIIQNRETGARETVYAQYLIAADGANSRIRQALGVQMSGRGTLSYNMNLYFRAKLKPYVEGREFSICNINHPEATGTLVSINNDDLWTFHVNFDPARGESLNDFPDERCIQLIRKAVGNPELDVKIISVLPWEAAVKVADRFQVNRIFLVGDAAHLMPPTGGFGGNSGIADGHNLAWKLAAVLKGMAAPELLSTYEIERKAVSHFTTEQAGLIANTGQLNMVGSKKESIAPVTSNNHVIMRYQYRSSAVITEDADSERSLTPYVEQLDGKPGTRAPHIWLERNGHPISTIDLFNKNFVLIADEYSTWIQTAQYVAADFNNLTIDIFTIGQTGSLQDPENRWHKIYRIPAGGAVLIRPDGFVAWRSGQAESSTETFSWVMKQLLSLENN